VLQRSCGLLLLPFQFACNGFVLLQEHLATTQRVDRAPLCRGHQPRSGVFGDAFFGPEFERSDQGILGQFFCDADIVGDSGDGSDEPCGLDLPHGLNRLRHIFHAC
jgi:hypothetical protein